MTQTGSEWLASLPETPCAERDDLTLQAAQNGLLQLDWVPIVSTVGEDSGQFWVLADAAYILDETNGARFRPQVSATLQQKIADILDVSFCTAKVCDLGYIEAGKNGLQINATIIGASPQMANTSVSKHWNDLIEKKRNGFVGLIKDVGKSWILSNRLGNGVQSGTYRQSINYGFYDTHSPNSPSPVGLKGWQLGGYGNPAGAGGGAHLSNENDYSQVMHFMKKSCQINGQDMSIEDIFTDSKLSHLINYDGVLKYTRQP